MPTIGRHYHGRARDAYPVACSYCGVPWPREKMRQDGAGRWMCPDDRGLDATTLDRMNARKARHRRPPPVADAPIYKMEPLVEPGDEVPPEQQWVSPIPLSAGATILGPDSVVAQPDPDQVVMPTPIGAVFAASNPTALHPSEVAPTPLAASASITGPASITVEHATEAIFGAKVVETWDAVQAAVDGAGEVISWTGINGAEAFPPAGRPSYEAANPSFNDQPTINTSRLNQHGLAATGISPPLVAGGAAFGLLAVMRAPEDFLRGHIVMWSVAGDAVYFFNGFGTGFRASTPAGGIAAIADDNGIDASEPALWWGQHDPNDATEGWAFEHNDTTATPDGAPDEMAELTAIGFGRFASWAVDYSTAEIALVVVLNDAPTEGEMNSFRSYVTSRFGIAFS